jgi:hypothetical protein
MSSELSALTILPCQAWLSPPVLQVYGNTLPSPSRLAMLSMEMIVKPLHG